MPPQSSPSPVPTGDGSAAEAMARLCIAPKPSDGKEKQAGETPADIAEIEDQVQTVRELRFTHPVAVNPIDDATMDRKLSKSFDQTYPVTFYARRTERGGRSGSSRPGPTSERPCSRSRPVRSWVSTTRRTANSST